MILHSKVNAPPELVFPDRLKDLIRHCETVCDAGCCGMDAYNFAPLHIASYLFADSYRTSDIKLAEWETELSKAEALASGLVPNEQGFICSVAGMGSFRRDDLSNFIGTLRLGINLEKLSVTHSSSPIPASSRRSL
jgi:hypothetical protein